MSSLPLISHHLFVAAVKSRNRGARRAARAEKADRPKTQVVEIPLELINVSTPVATENLWPFGAASRSRSV